jgi:hypothetical protein
LKEANVKMAVKKYLKSVHAWQFWPVQMGMGAAGLDCFVCFKGQFYGIEVKREGITTVTPRQACVMRDIAEAGGGVCLENSVGCETVKLMIK